ncbi:GL26445 [Drosophila persimilis]|uniref:Transcription initiation factor TFIID subunit 10 n=2 Tax=pseudoobscura subgroup TaxID=32358 RepID=Q29KW4_DROPS|nr:transcription initiation factor TFIID subunit 10b [Drosophila pseudoobscura]XP_002021567.1 transcription initiation factor TFIID subunit 10b [Drosophila persimilis]XP_017151529.1 transcription initiation factor TFIID subunit 10b [Drosophila miranda]EDW25410.1 GL26445 [Drosophila persimilis]
MVGSNFGIIYGLTGPSNQGASSAGQGGAGMAAGGGSADRDRLTTAAHLSDFMLQLEDYTPLIPDAVTAHYLNLGGFQADDKRIVRLISIAAQKYMSEIMDDALQHSKARTHLQTTNTPGGSKAKDRKFTLTMEDLQPALADYGINVRKMDYSQ